MKYVLVDENDMVVNTIVYNGTDAYTPPAGLTVKQANEWITIGHHIDTPEPVSPLIDEAEAKDARNAIAANDLTIMASYKMALVDNPDLSFNDHMDSLESMATDVKARVQAESKQSLPANP